MYWGEFYSTSRGVCQLPRKRCIARLVRIQHFWYATYTPSWWAIWFLVHYSTLQIWQLHLLVYQIDLHNMLYSYVMPYTSYGMHIGSSWFAIWISFFLRFHMPFLTSYIPLYATWSSMTRHTPLSFSSYHFSSKIPKILVFCDLKNVKFANKSRFLQLSRNKWYQWSCNEK